MKNISVIIGRYLFIYLLKQESNLNILDLFVTFFASGKKKKKLF
jgi:hypothetical protein